MHDLKGRKAPYDKGGKKAGHKAKLIPLPYLGDLEYAKLEKLLPIYEENLKALCGKWKAWLDRKRAISISSSDPSTLREFALTAAVPLPTAIEEACTRR